jgi:hypothetical protein
MIGPAAASGSERPGHGLNAVTSTTPDILGHPDIFVGHHDIWCDIATMPFALCLMS